MAKHPLPSPAALALQIEVVGSDLDGQQYIERTQTLTITRDGATILLANKLAAEMEMIVRNLETGEEAIARVVGHVREDISGHVYGMALIDPSVDLWRVQLSPPECGKPTNLECSRCHTVKSVPLTEIEMEVFESKRALTRKCVCSNSSTVWKETTRDVSVEKRDISFQRQPERAASIGRERRKDRRTVVKSVACIRHGGNEEIAECEDMSRGGFRFKSRKEYPEGTRIEAAVPYAQGNLNIFVPAQIAYHQKLSAESHRHGVAYLKTRRDTGQK